MDLKNIIVECGNTNIIKNEIPKNIINNWLELAKKHNAYKITLSTTNEITYMLTNNYTYNDNIELIYNNPWYVIFSVYTYNTDLKKFVIYYNKEVK